MSEADPIGPRTAKEVITDYLLKFPLRYCVPVIMGVPETSALQNASATLMTMPDGKNLIITNWHVIEIYRRLLKQERTPLFQIGEFPFDPEPRILDEDQNSDLAVLDAEGIPFKRSGIDIPDLESYKNGVWPPAEVLEGDWVIFGGWPAKHREPGKTWDEFIQDSYSLAATDVTAAFPDRFHCKFDRTGWTLGNGSNSDPRLLEKELSGLSGCPVLRVRHADGRDALLPELVGFVMEYNPDLDKLVMTLAGNIKRDGSLWHNTKR